MNYTVPAIGVRVYDGAINDCDKIIEWCEQQGWNRSRVSGDQNDGVSEIRTSKTLFVPFLSYANVDVIYNMNKTIWTLFDDYAKYWDFSFSDVQHPSIQKYDIGDHYKLHSDSGTGMLRVVSAVAYLNTVEEGGRTVFPHMDIAVEAVEGRVVIFPSDYVYAHEAEAPKSNTKYAAAFWAVP